LEFLVGITQINPSFLHMMILVLVSWLLPLKKGLDPNVLLFWCQIRRLNYEEQYLALADRAHKIQQ
jgi:hypothetical protein